MNAQDRNQFSGRMSAVVLVSTLLLTSLGMPVVARAALPAGDIVIGADIGATNNFDWGLLLIDPTTGNRTILSDNTVGSGPAFSSVITSVTPATDGSLIVTSEGGIPNSNGVSPGVLFRVDPSTGNRSIISSSTANSGDFSYYIGARSFGSSILMSGYDIVSVDPTTGNRTIVSGASRGSGEQLGAYGFSIVGTDLFVANSSLGDIVKVDTLTGNRTVVSSASVGTGPGLAGADPIPFDVEPDHSGNLLAIVVFANTSSDSTAILSIDPSTGNRTLLSGLGVGTGPGLPQGFAGALGVAADGTLYTNHDNSGSFTFQGPVLRIDPATGNRTIVSDATHGTGPLFAPTPALMVVPNVPEPSTIVLAAFGMIALLAYRRRIA